MGYTVFSMKLHFEVKKARNGKGVFLKDTVKAGTVLFQIRGTFLTCFEDEEIDEEIRNNTFRFDENLFLSPEGEIANFVNHSCLPNAKVVKKDNALYMVSITAISKGEEVVFDYSTILARDDVWTMKCNCGSSQCRKNVRQFRKLPTSLQKRYIADGIVPQYITEI